MPQVSKKQNPVQVEDRNNRYLPMQSGLYSNMMLVLVNNN
jgi:hypothetical protein